MDEEIKGKIKLIADTYGYDEQSRQCIEETEDSQHYLNEYQTEETRRYLEV